MNQKLVLDHIPLALKMARRRSLCAPPNVSLDDLRSAAYMGLVDAASKFDPSMGNKFSSYAMIRMDGEMKDCMRSIFMGGRTRPISEGEDFPCESVRSGPELDLSCLDDSESKLVRLYYFEDKTMKDIGSSEGLSESRVSQILKSSRRKLKKKMEGVSS